MAGKIDEIDRKILEILRTDARISNERLGKQVNLSEPAARRRVANLIKRGIIHRFTIDIDEAGGVQALVFLSTAPHISSEKLAKQLESEQGVGYVWETSGDMDIAITLSAPDMSSLNHRLDAIRALPVIRKTQTSVIMKKWR